MYTVEWMGKMHRVVIIDDEPIIVEGLSKTVDWGKYSCQVIGSAYSGEEGVSLIRRERPDIIFSDIRMTGMDGLSMIAAIKSEFPDTQIAILTGYRNFDYAQKAIRLGVSRFLLKPSKMDELNEALQAMTEKLEMEKENQKTERRLQSFLEERGDSAAAAETENKELQKKAETDEELVLDSAASSFIVKNAVGYIEEHYQEKLKLSDVADQVYVSQWHLSKLLNRYLGQNFSEILNGIRINKAKELLKDPALRIGDIADEVGFLDMAHFSRVFKKQVGISANEYRNHL